MRDNNQDNHLNISEFFDSNLITQKNTSTTERFQNIEPILKSEYGYHYLCPICHIFPFIEFTKSKKYVKFTCSCYDDKEILIKDLFDKNNNYIIINDLANTNLLSSTTIVNNDDNYEGLKCKKHDLNFNFKYYWYPGLLNICEECQKYFEFDQHDLIDLESILIDKNKLNE